MPVDHKHEAYSKWFPEWEKMRRVLEGEQAVKDAKSQYLPVPSGMARSEILDPVIKGGSSSGLRFNTYEDYVTRASFFDATARTVEALMGLISTKKPMIKGAPSLEEPKTVVTADNQSVESLARWVLWEALAVSRAGLLIDAPPAVPGGPPKPKPYIASYAAENMTNWRTEIDVDGRERCSMICLSEQEQHFDPGDPFEPINTTIFRVLRCGRPDEMFAAGPSEEDVQKASEFLGSAQPMRPDQLGPTMLGSLNGLRSGDWSQKLVYWQEEWVENAKKNSDQKKDRFSLRRRLFPRAHSGRLLERIPFVATNGVKDTLCPSKPVLLGVANLALSHFRNSADYEHGMHYTALPTAWAAGFKLADGDNLSIGSAVAWISDDPQASCGFLEFTGAGLGSIEKALDRKERMMAVLGARLLDKQKRGVETAESMTIRQEGDRSVASLVAFETAKAMTAALKELLLWEGKTEEAEAVLFNFNHDLDVTKLSSEEIRTLMLTWQAGALSWETFFENMRRGGVYGDDADMELEQERIKNGLLPAELLTDDGDDEDDPTGEENRKQKPDGKTKLDRKATRS